MISVITPVLNGAEHIEACLLNVIDQGCDDVEHIVVDGLSDDHTPDIIRRYADQYGHIRWISEKDCGQSHAMNKGLEMARGEIVGFLNCDDFYQKNVLSKIKQIFQDLVPPSLIVGNCNLINHEGRVVYVNKPKRLGLKDLLLGYKTNPFPINPSAYFYHKSIHEKVGEYRVDLHYCMDLDFILNAVRSANVVYYDAIWGNHQRLKNTKTFRMIQNGSLKSLIDGVMNRHIRYLNPLDRLLVRLYRKLFDQTHSRYLTRIAYYAIYPREIHRMLIRKAVKIFCCGSGPRTGFHTNKGVESSGNLRGYDSPIPNSRDIKNAVSSRLTRINNPHIKGININYDQQRKNLVRFIPYYKDLLYSRDTKHNTRYDFNNIWFNHTDAIILYSVIRHFRPKRIIEIGSGFSSALILDTREHFLDYPQELTFIEPNPHRLEKLFRADDYKQCKIIKKNLLDIDPGVFMKLKENDILFIDSAHTFKAGSPLNHLYFNIISNLPKGVLIHIHDIFWPFEYPVDWLKENRAYNELYFLHAFLYENNAFEIEFFNSYMTRFDKDEFKKHMPLCLKGEGGSLWLRKVR